MQSKQLLPYCLDQAKRLLLFKNKFEI